MTISSGMTLLKGLLYSGTSLLHTCKGVARGVVVKAEVSATHEIVSPIRFRHLQASFCKQLLGVQGIIKQLASAVFVKDRLLIPPQKKKIKKIKKLQLATLIASYTPTSTTHLINQHTSRMPLGLVHIDLQINLSHSINIVQ